MFLCCVFGLSERARGDGDVYRRRGGILQCTWEKPNAHLMHRLRDHYSSETRFWSLFYCLSRWILGLVKKDANATFKSTPPRKRTPQDRIPTRHRYTIVVAFFVLSFFHCVRVSRLLDVSGVFPLVVYLGFPGNRVSSLVASLLACFRSSLHLLASFNPVSQSRSCFLSCS